jgi:hypothetical protein
MNALIGSGFFAADANDFKVKAAFMRDCWLPNVGDRDVVIVDNSEAPTPKLTSSGRVRIITVNKNLGHVGAHLGKFRPHLLGWGLSWILPALVAYSEGRDFIYQEADCLAFGDWEESILADMVERKLIMAFGEGSDFAATEQSLFYIKHEHITEMVYHYLSLPEGDGKCLPEEKFKIMADRDWRIGRFSLQGGRQRPLPFESDTFYAQKISPEELEQLKIVGFI